MPAKAGIQSLDSRQKHAGMTIDINKKVILIDDFIICDNL